jgi:2,4-dienoyl-CoA reductase-like NADH-dependent reductase (Old Yellow Enzyme family)
MAGLLSPLSVAGLTLRNRIVMPPMWSGQSAPDGAVTDAIVEYHRCRAAAGCGLVIVEHAFVHPRGRHTATQIGVHSDAMMPGLARLAAAIRAEGAVACLQISHAGARSTSSVAGATPLGPSAVRHAHMPADGETPVAMTPGQIAEVVAAFGASAVRARAAGFDAVEVHAAHGFLLSEFLSPLSNRREDAYGGSDENRRRLHLEVLAEVRTCLALPARPVAGDPAHRACASGGVTREFPVFVRLGMHDETPGGVDLDMSSAAADALVRGGADLIDVSGGLQGSRGAAQGPGYFVPYAEALKARVNVPVMVTGGIADPEFADRIVREGRADLVGIGRAMLNDAAWAGKAIARLGKE